MRVWRSAIAARARRLEALTALIALLPGCDGALAHFAPEQKNAVPMILRPESGRQGGEPLLIALPAVSSEGEIFVTESGFEADIDIVQFDTGLGRGCQLQGVDELLEREGLERSEFFPICYFIAIDPNAAAGPNELTMELKIDGVPIIARASFLVLEAQPSRQSEDAGVVDP
ncbi:MAG: hypothetical protein CMH57_03870 [Myxococcales bacterium]|nr:hypothetical protein [Myxococcales bacterium]